MKSYFNLFYYSFLTILMYPYELIMTVISPILEVGILALFWNMVAENSKNPVDLKSIIVYFIIVQFVSAWSISPSGLNFSGYLGREIKYGRLTQHLIRPTSALPSIFFKQRGYSTVDMIYSFPFLLIAIILIGNVSIKQFIFFLVFLILSFVISFSICVLIGSIAFATKEISGIRHSAAHLIRLLSGSMVPLTFFPQSTQNILRLTPFPSMVFAPINILQHESALATVYPDLLISLAWSIVLLELALYSWKKGLRNYEAIGI